MSRFPAIRLRGLAYGLGMLWLVVQVALVHRWFVQPYAVWIGCDEAYITAFGQRLLEGHWVPYVDAVSHRGPVLYWVSAILQAIGGRNSWAAIRAGSLIFNEVSLVLVFAIGAVARKPLAGFLGAAIFVWAATFALPAHDGIALNGEIVSLPFVLGATLLTLAGTRDGGRAESRMWLAAGSGALVVIGGLSKQPAFVHLLPIALWWWSDARKRQAGASSADWRPLLALGVGAATPLLALVSFYLRAGHLRALLYYLVTYNRKVYLAPITVGVAIEALYGFCRAHAELVLLVVVGAAWWLGRMLHATERVRSARSWLAAYSATALSSTVTAQALLAFAGACSTFRFFDHYFVSAVPWLGLMLGLIVDERIESGQPRSSARGAWARAIIVGSLVGMLALMGKVHTHWLDGQRRLGFFGDPHDEPITNYVVANTRPTDRIFTWGFAPEYYVSTGRRAASRFVYTTFVAGLVPWFDRYTVEQEDALAVPGSREVLLRELELEQPELILDVPNSLRNRSMRRYEMLASYVESMYCYEATIVGRNGHTSDIYRRRHGDCARPMPPR
ncbi:MAG: hypothetical protein HY898_00800 [Deltaproteobacteria bacterium]|nr:hypothetical protein [Deltaproteobacteria bacterium]